MRFLGTTGQQYINPCEQLVIGRLFPLDGLQDIDYCEALDAVHEDADGLLPHERTAEIIEFPRKRRLRRAA